MEEDYRLSEAQALYEQACKLDPNKHSAFTHNSLGKLLSYQGHDEEAFREYAKSLSFNPKYDLATINIATTYASLGQVEKAKQYYSQYVNEHPAGTRILEANEYLQYISTEGVGESLNEIANDYLGKVLSLGICIWPKSAMPIKVFIEPGAKVDGCSDAFKDALIHCFDEWANESGDRISWQLSSQEADADIVCQWTSNPREEFKENNIHSQAWTNWHTIPGKNGVRLMNHAIIKICTKNAVSGKPASLQFLKAACLHEVGHALGILAHSPVYEDVMFASEPSSLPTVKLSVRDSATLKRLYEAGDAAQAQTETTFTVKQ